MKTILVTGASGVVGYGVLKSLRQSDEDYHLIGATIYNDSVAPAFCDVFELALPTNDNNYMDWLCGVIEKHKIDIIIPGIDADMQMWNQERERIAKTGVFALLNDSELIKLCSDKWLFYEALKGVDSTLAIESRLDGDFDSLNASFGLPFLLKPRKGFASKGIVIVEDRETFDRNKDNLGSVLMAQPIIGTNDEEYSISAFFDNKSRLCCMMSLRRKLAAEGFTEKAIVDTPDGAELAIRELAKLFKPVGPTNFQFRVQNGQLKLLEINPRISSATSIRAGFGYNESVISVEYFLSNVTPSQPTIASGYAVRYIEDHIFHDSHIV